jgi:hypothetical protein
MGNKMSHPTGQQPTDSEPASGEVQYLLVGSLVGTILLLIVYAIFAYAVH